MARQQLGKRKLAKYSKQHGITFMRGFVRGNTDHRVDLFDENGVLWCLYSDGELRKSEFQPGVEFKKQVVGWLTNDVST